MIGTVGMYGFFCCDWRLTAQTFDEFEFGRQSFLRTTSIEALPPVIIRENPIAIIIPPASSSKFEYEHILLGVKAAGQAFCS
jgi:hypothetical protein